MEAASCSLIYTYILYLSPLHLFCVYIIYIHIFINYMYSISLSSPSLLHLHLHLYELHLFCFSIISIYSISISSTLILLLAQVPVHTHWGQTNRNVRIGPENSILQGHVRVAHALKIPSSMKRLGKSFLKARWGKGGHSVCGQFMHNSLADGEVTGQCHRG